MSKCFVIQPFDKGKFDKRFDDTIRPAIEDAGLEPYRVDQDPNVEIPIEAIEQGIRESSICVADITTDNPNVWYELGYAFASNKPVVMTCSDERTTGRYPFDIQHRTIVHYQSDSSSDFMHLKQQVTERLVALLEKGERLREIAESDPLEPIEGLSQPELTVLATLADEAAQPDSMISISVLQHHVERTGLTAVGFGLGIRRLLRKELVAIADIENDFGNVHQSALVTESGWNWIEQNEEMFALKKRSTPTVGDFDDDIPF